MKYTFVNTVANHDPKENNGNDLHTMRDTFFYPYKDLRIHFNYFSYYRVHNGNVNYVNSRTNTTVTRHWPHVIDANKDDVVINV